MVLCRTAEDRKSQTMDSDKGVEALDGPGEGEVPGRRGYKASRNNDGVRVHLGQSQVKP